MVKYILLIPFWIIVGIILALPAVAAESELNVKDYLSNTVFTSGYRAPSACETTLLSDTLAAMSQDVPTFRKLSLNQKITELHSISHAAFLKQIFRVDDLEALADTKMLESTQVFPLSSKQLFDFSVRMKVLADTPVKKLQPYYSELLAMTFEVGTLVHFSHRMDPRTVGNLLQFYSRVLTLVEPAEWRDEVLTVYALGHLAVLHGSQLDKAQNPSIPLHGAMEALIKAVRYAQKAKVVEPVLHAGLLVTNGAAAAFSYVAPSSRSNYIQTVEHLYLGIETILEHVPADPLLLAYLDVLAESPNLAKFPKMAGSLDRWLKLAHAQQNGRMH